MEKTVKITFTEQAHAVVATTQIEYNGKDIPSNDEILTEAQTLFNKAQSFSVAKTMQKRR